MVQLLFFYNDGLSLKAGTPLKEKKPNQINLLFICYKVMLKNSPILGPKNLLHNLFFSYCIISIFYYYKYN